MKIFTVHRLAGTTTEDTKSVRFVPEGFAWLGFLLAPFWLVWHRLWRWLLAYLVLSALLVVGALFLGFSEPTGTWLSLLLGLFVGLEGNNWRRAALSRRGYVDDGVAAGATLEEAELAYFAARGLPAPLPARAPAAPAAAQTASQAASPVGGIGLFSAER